MADVHEVDRSSRFTSDNSRYQQLRAEREVERLQAIRDGQIPDPSQGGMSLSDAITLRGTCSTMCPEFERVEREYQLSLDKYELYTDAHDTHVRQADPVRTVKTFHRPSAGDETSLPSDVRPPAVLKQTLNYLFHSILAEDKDLHDSHHFVRDRTRSIRQDFTLQHIREEIAIECHERIARYHILCLHELCDRSGWSDQQEIEQLSKVLLSLTEFYDDWRSSTGAVLPNEAEFRAYHLLIHLRDSSTAAAAERLPMDLYLSQPIQLALKFHAFARRSNEAPLRGRPHNTESSPNAYSRFFKLVHSPRTPFLMACLLETSFSQVRRGAFKAMRIAYPSKYRPYPIADLVKVLGCDDSEQLVREAENLGLEVERDNDIPVAVKVNKQSQINDSGPTIPHMKSHLVAAKRGRLSARDIIDTPLAIDGVAQSKSDLRPTAPVFAMPSTNGFASTKNISADVVSPSTLMPPPPKPTPSTSAFSFQPKPGILEQPKTSTFNFSGKSGGAFSSAFSAPASTSSDGFPVSTSAPPPTATAAAPTTSPTETNLKEKLQQQQEAKRVREKEESERDREREQQKQHQQQREREAFEQEQKQARRRLSENRKLEERLQVERAEEEQRKEKQERRQLIHTISNTLTNTLLEEIVATTVRSYVLEEVASAFRKHRLTRLSVHLWKKAAVARVIRREVERERLEQFRVAVGGMSFGRSSGRVAPVFTLPQEEEEEEELFDHEDEEVVEHRMQKQQVSDSEMEQKLHEQTQQRNALWDKGGAISVIVESIHKNATLMQFESVDVGLYTHNDSTSSSTWLRTKFGADSSDYIDVDSQLSFFVNADQPSLSTAVVLFECSPNLARQLSDDERSKILNDDKRRLEIVTSRLATANTFVPTIVLLSWCNSSLVECLRTTNYPFKYLQISPQSFDSQLRTLMESIDVGVKDYETTTPKQLSGVFSSIALTNIHNMHQTRIIDMDKEWHLHIALLNSSIAILNEVIKATNESVGMLSENDDITPVKTLPLLKVKESTPLQTALIEWLDDERFDFESDILLLRAEIAGWDADHSETIYVMARILEIVFTGADEQIILCDGTNLDEETLVERTEFVKRTRRIIVEFERRIDRVRVGHDQRYRQRKRDDEKLVQSNPPSHSPSPMKKKAVSSGVLKDLISSVRSSLFAK